MTSKSPTIAWKDLTSICSTFTSTDTTLQCIHTLPSGRRCRKQFSSDRTARLTTLWHSAQNSNDFWLSTTTADLKALVQALRCSVHLISYHDLYVQCRNHLFSQQQQAWDLAKSSYHRYDRRWLDLTAEVEGKQAPDAWAVHFYGLDVEEVQKKIPWPTTLEGHVPKLGTDRVADFFTRSMASNKYSVNFTTTPAVQDLEFAINFLRSERSRWAPLINVYGGSDGVRERAENDVVALALSNVVDAMKGMLGEYERRLKMARDDCEAGQATSGNSKRKREEDGAAEGSAKRAKTDSAARETCEGEGGRGADDRSWVSWICRIFL